MSDYIIIGNGIAGITAAEQIHSTDSSANITMVTDEDLPFYNRIRLNEYISSDINETDLLSKSSDWYDKHNIDLKLSTKIVDADSGQKTLKTEKGDTLKYDKLLIATGSHSFIPPIEGSDTTGVFAIRNVDDARKIISHAQDVEDVVVIGGGLLGLEAANAFRKMGKRVTIVEFFPRLLPRQLDVDGAKRLQTTMEEMGFSFRLDARTEKIEGSGSVEGVRLAGGETLKAQMVIISAGVRPNMDIAGPLGIDTDKGIKVDNHLCTSNPDIYAAGDVAEHGGMVYGIWPASQEQAKVAGVNMAGGDDHYHGTTMANTLKVVGIDLASAGDIDADGNFASKVLSDGGIYKKIVIDDNKIIGCIMLGNTKGFIKVTRLMKDKTDIAGKEDDILNGNF